jgi:hypothetical protein
VVGRAKDEARREKRTAPLKYMVTVVLWKGELLVLKI